MLPNTADGSLKRRRERWGGGEREEGGTEITGRKGGKFEGANTKKYQRVAKVGGTDGERIRFYGGDKGNRGWEGSGANSQMWG